MQQLSGRTRFQLIDEDGDELPGTWEFSWDDRDPFEAVLAAVTEASGRPWKYTARNPHGGRFSPDKAGAMAIRVKNVLSPELRPRVAAVIARVISDGWVGKKRRVVKAEDVLAVLSGRRVPGPDELDAEPESLAAMMLLALRSALLTAREHEVGLRVAWQVE